MAYDENLAKRVRAALGRRKGIAEKKMFGGLCFLMNGHMFSGIVNDDLIVRVGPDAYDKALKERHVRPMDFSGRPMKGMVYVAAGGLASEEVLKHWLGRGIRFARSLPPKN